MTAKVTAEVRVRGPRASRAKVQTAQSLRALVKEDKAASRSARHHVGGVIGLYLRTLFSGRGTAVWEVRTEVNGKRTCVSLGSYESKSLAEVRVLAAEIQRRAKAGEPLRDDEPIQQKKLFAVRRLFPEWLEWLEKTRKYKSSKELEIVKARFERYVLPVIGDKQPQQITGADMTVILTKVQEAGNKLATFDKIRAKFNLMWAWFVEQDLVSEERRNPTQGLVAVSRTRQLQSNDGDGNHPALAPTRIPALIAALCVQESLYRPATLGLLFAILTCSRSAMIRGYPQSGVAPLKWGQIDFDNATVAHTAHGMKTNKAFVVPLSRQALQVLELIGGLQITDSDNPEAMVFANSAGHALGESAMNNRIKAVDEEDRAGGGEGFRDGDSGRIVVQHGVSRASFRTWARHEGKSAEIAELCLAHWHSSYKGAYERYSPDIALEPRRELLQEWADFCFSACPPDVLDFPKK